MSEEEKEREREKDGWAAEATAIGAEAGGCCLLSAISSLALILSASLLLLNR